LSKYELIIQRGKELLIPVVTGAVVWDVDRFGNAGRLTFSVINDEGLEIQEGDPVRFKVDGVTVFYGFTFRTRVTQDTVQVTAYDQLRYLKNKDTMVYKGITADALIRRIASEFNLRTGTLAPTGYTIPPRVEDNQTLADMIKNALDLTLQNSKRLFVLYDVAGQITLTDIEAMRLDLLLDGETGEGYELDTSIDGSTYNKIKLVRPNETTGLRDVFITQDSGNINKWGVLQYYDTLKDGENGKAKADALLELLNRPERAFTAKNILGDLRVRGGSSLAVRVNLGARSINNFMIVDSVRHTFIDNEHLMDLKLRGGK
jgi:hypothetical protein